ncbi:MULTISPECIES: ROK family transcriptional regulator [unclassified Arthrobacter]|uniref:ROK family transcriptional regulator n=1 Tax=unclassified Arthrobacter TaxID=235627 RepID=UPI0006FB4F89|nr:ROK family transcriptional regulator [Arthrobacter sp. Leaf234]KQO01770.1 ArsR family transcriptional regulator [Arthrobacter sp. Leaf234]
MPADSPSTARTSLSAPLPKPGSQSALREQNQQRVIAALMSGGPQTQAELSRQTGLSTATVSNIVKVMAATGIVSTAPTTSSGRRALSVILNDNGQVAAGIDIGRRHLRVVLASPNYRVLQEASVALPLGHSAVDGLTAASDLLDSLLENGGIRRRALLGAGIGIPGPIDRRTGTVVQGAILPEWVGINIHETFSERLRVPVFIDNDANLGALAQVTWGPHSAVDNLMFMKVGSGIGAGLVLNGSLYYGNVGVTGELGHTTINEQGVICRCGNRGCLETVASTSTMIELLGRGSNETVDTQRIIDWVLAGDTAALRVIDDAGVAIGRALAHMANLINPETIVIGGPLTGLGEILLEPVRRGLARHAVPIIGDTTNVCMSSLGDRAEALGAAAVVLAQQGLAPALASSA